MALEYERKYSATPELLERIRQQLRGEWHTWQMRTTYYDTPDGSLSGRKWTLRRRLENGVSVCTLKTPAGDARGEWEVEADTIEAAIPMLCKRGCPEALVSLTQAGVVEVCGARFTRQTLLLEEKDCLAELALDVGELFSASRQEPLCEVELELKAGSPEALDALTRKIAEEYGLVPLTASKFKRALSLRRK